MVSISSFISIKIVSVREVIISLDVLSEKSKTLLIISFSIQLIVPFFSDCVIISFISSVEMLFSSFISSLPVNFNISFVDSDKILINGFEIFEMK